MNGYYDCDTATNGLWRHDRFEASAGIPVAVEGARWLESVSGWHVDDATVPAVEPTVAMGPVAVVLAELPVPVEAILQYAVSERRFVPPLEPGSDGI